MPAPVAPCFASSPAICRESCSGSLPRTPAFDISGNNPNSKRNHFIKNLCRFSGSAWSRGHARYCVCNPEGTASTGLSPAAGHSSNRHERQQSRLGSAKKPCQAFLHNILRTQKVLAIHEPLTRQNSIPVVAQNPRGLFCVVELSRNYRITCWACRDRQ
jgi:hypothetical protein